MAFTLRDVRTGTVRSFTTREILSLLGDSINDEILIGQQRYRISSCEETGGGGGEPNYYQIDWQKFQLPVQQGNQTLFVLPHEITDAESVFLTVNNVLYEHGENRDFHLGGGRELYWHGGFTLDTNDRLVVRYPLLVGNQ